MHIASIINLKFITPINKKYFPLFHRGKQSCWHVITLGDEFLLHHTQSNSLGTRQWKYNTIAPFNFAKKRRISSIVED